MASVAEQRLHRTPAGPLAGTFDRVHGRVALAPADQFRPELEAIRRQGSDQGFENRAPMDQQGGQLPFVSGRWRAIDQITAQIAHHKVKDRPSLPEDAIQETVNGARGDSLHPVFDQQDAAAVRAEAIGLFKHPHPVALAVQQGGQQQAGATRAHHGDVERLAGHDLESDWRDPMPSRPELV